jgi:hypothetical protein
LFLTINDLKNKKIKDLSKKPSNIIILQLFFHTKKIGENKREKKNWRVNLSLLSPSTPRPSSPSLALRLHIFQNGFY